VEHILHADPHEEMKPAMLHAGLRQTLRGREDGVRMDKGEMKAS